MQLLRLRGVAGIELCIHVNLATITGHLLHTVQGRGWYKIVHTCEPYDHYRPSTRLLVESRSHGPDPALKAMCNVHVKDYA